MYCKVQAVLLEWIHVVYDYLLLTSFLYVKIFTGITGNFNNFQIFDLGTFSITGFGDYNHSSFKMNIFCCTKLTIEN